MRAINIIEVLTRTNILYVFLENVNGKKGGNLRSDLRTGYNNAQFIQLKSISQSTQADTKLMMIPNAILYTWARCFSYERFVPCNNIFKNKRK